MLHSSVAGQKAIIVWDTTEIPSLDLAEIEIRASKQNTSAKKLPASVSLISEHAIAVNEIQSLKDISGITPGFYMPDYGSRLTSPVYIRGIGSRINSPSVGLYVDHVPYFEKAAFDFDFFDVERIEVLKGPQGTLYGRNTMGGIINITTVSPLNHRGTNLFLSGGSHGNFGSSIGHYGGIGETFGYSLSANFRHREGYYTNAYNNSRVDKSNSLGLRNRLEWDVNDRLKIENIASAEFSSEGGYPYALVNDSLLVPEDINYNMPSSYARSLFSDAFLINFRGSNAEIRSTTSYQYLDDLQRIDQDFTADSAYFVEQDQQQHMLSQEVIIKSVRNQRINWLFGAYGFLQQFDKTVEVAMFQRNMTLLKDYDYTIGGGAVFHQSTINDLFTEGLSLTAGIRLDYELDVLDYVYERELGGIKTTLMDTLFPDLSYFRLLPKIALNYVAGRTSVYAVVANGYKSGGFNSTFYRDEELFFDPEESWNYEAGVKTSFFDRSVYADIALFYIDWSNQQIYQTASYDDGSPAPGSFLSNAGESVSKGGEITLKSIPVLGISPVLSYGYTHAVFTRHVVDEDTDLSGNAIPYVPRHTLSAQLSRTFPIQGSKLLDTFGVNLLYRGLGRIYWNEENTFSTGFYNLLDLKFTLSRNNMQLELWGRNLLNTSYESFYFQALGNQYVQMGKPLRFGLNLRYSF
jgi:outer membrane receptor protein involved in Fe transport